MSYSLPSRAQVQSHLKINMLESVEAYKSQLKDYNFHTAIGMSSSDQPINDLTSDTNDTMRKYQDCYLYYKLKNNTTC